jgi:hypothetical protein
MAILARQGSSHPIIGPEPVLGISAKFAMEVIRDKMSRKHDEHWQSICGQRQVNGFLKKNPLQRKNKKTAGDWLNLSRNQLQTMTGLLTGHCILKGYLFKLGLANSPQCNRRKQASETASHVLCDRLWSH